MNLRQKVFLTGIFLLVGFTIAVTILRGIFFSGVGKTPGTPDNTPIDPKWTLFSFFIQYAVCESLLSFIRHFSIGSAYKFSAVLIVYFIAFIIACIISFRSMWVNQERRLKERNVENKKKHPHAHKHLSSAQREKNARWNQFHDTLMQTLWELEGADMEWDGSHLLNHEPPSGRLTVEFSQWDSTSASGSSPYATTSTQHSQAHVASSV